MTVDGAAPCPCGLAEPYDLCCGRFHAGTPTAATAELLMRSRYSAFAVGDEAYLLLTWHRSTRPGHLELDPRQRWLRLEILGSTGGGLFESTGTVEFRALFRGGMVQENSRFERVDGRWVYVGPMPGI